MIKKIEGNNFRTRVVNSGPKWRLPWPPKYPQWYNKRCHYLDGLYSSLVHFKPKYCLEIGTHKGDNSTAVFQKYFNKFMPEGVLITLDIVPCEGLSLKNVNQVLVSPHHERIYESCGASGKWFDSNKSFDPTNSVLKNCKKITDFTKKLDFSSFDFCFLDGDHEKESFLGDMETANNLLSEKGVIMIDDTKEEYHPCCHIFQEEIRTSGQYEVYDFDDWSDFIGCSIIWRK
jgi:hypothetical protein